MSRQRNPRRFRFGLRILAMGVDPETGQDVSREFTVKGRADMRRLTQDIRACGYTDVALRNLGPAPHPGRPGARP